MKKILLFVTLFCFLSFELLLFAQTPAFPGAEGGGMYTTGGRPTEKYPDAEVYFVTDLGDENKGNAATREGDLRWCIFHNRTSKPRTVLFKVAGIIRLKSRITITQGNLSILGQSAPGDGICIADYNIKIGSDGKTDANNIIIRYIRIRMGDEAQFEDDAMWSRYQSDLIIDHCSFSWSTDECISFYSNENVTIQWCFITESLNNSLHEKGAHGYGGIWGGKNTTFHHNLLAHHNSRNPRFNGWKRSGLDYNNPMDEETVDYRNNIIFNWGDNSAYGGESAGKYNIVNNYYKPGEATKTSSNVKTRIMQISIDKDPVNYPPGYGQFYIDGNYMDGSSTVTNNNWHSTAIAYDSGVNTSDCKASSPFNVTPLLTEETAMNAYESVLNYGGASYVRDAVDTRIISEVRSGKATYSGSVTKRKGLIDSQKDVGGWPEYTYEESEVWVDEDRDGIPDGWLEEYFPGKTANDVDDEGYTYLEVFWNGILEGKWSTVGINNGKINNVEKLVAYFDTGRIIVKTNSALKKIYVYDIFGKLLKTEIAGGMESIIDVNNYSSNLFVVKVELANGQFETSKVLK